MCLQLYQFWLVMQRCPWQPHSCRLECDCVCLIISQSLCCEMNAGQTRGGSALRLLCREWLSWKNFKESGVWSVFHFFLISAFAFSLFWIPSLCLSGTPLLSFFLWFYYHISSPCIHSLVSPLPLFLFISVSSPSSFLFFPHIPSDHWLLAMQGFDADSVLSEGCRDATAKYAYLQAAAKDWNNPLTPTKSRSTIRLIGLIFSPSLPWT